MNKIFKNVLSSWSSILSQSSYIPLFIHPREQKRSNLISWIIGLKSLFPNIYIYIYIYIFFLSFPFNSSMATPLQCNHLRHLKSILLPTSAISKGSECYEKIIEINEHCLGHWYHGWGTVSFCTFKNNIKETSCRQCATICEK